MTEELIAQFAQIGDLRVISRSSVMHFKNSAATRSREEAPWWS